VPRKVYDRVFIERKLREGRFRRVIANENGAWLREVTCNGLHLIATLRQIDQVSSCICDFKFQESLTGLLDSRGEHVGFRIDAIHFVSIRALDTNLALRKHLKGEDTASKNISEFQRLGRLVSYTLLWVDLTHTYPPFAGLDVPGEQSDQTRICTLWKAVSAQRVCFDNDAG